MPLSDAFPRRWLLIRQGAIGDTILVQRHPGHRTAFPQRGSRSWGFRNGWNCWRAEDWRTGPSAPSATPWSVCTKRARALHPALSEYLAGFDAVVYYGRAVSLAA